jgi:hypothetical protein
MGWGDWLGAGPGALCADIDEIGSLLFIRSAASNAWTTEVNWPPSEKESGVTLRIPMIQGRTGSSS